MKKLLIGGAIAAVSFVAGLAGLYYAVPLIAPDRAEEARLLVDSLAAASRLDSLALPDSSALNLTAALLPDSSALDSLGVLPDDDAAAAAAAAPPLSTGARAAAEDSLRSRLQAVEQERQALAARFEAMQKRESQRDEARAATSAAVTELAGTLAGLDEKELGAILTRLDIDVVRALYDRASGRNRARLLQAMPADRAAQFVQSLVRPDRPLSTVPPVAEAVTPDTSAPSDSP